MKKAFTMLELVFIIVVIGILISAIIPNTKTNSLQEAATQVLSHIRYTQHLAIVNDKYNSNNDEWYQERWRIRFKKDLVYSSLSPSGVYPDIWSYIIFSDANSHDGNPHLNEMAKNPLQSNKYLSGGYNDTLHVNDNKAMKELQLGLNYGITDIKFSGGCRSNILYIYFDYLGRPFNSMNSNKSYELASSGWHKLLTSNCLISLCKGSCTGESSDNEVIISIHKETGYACILDSDNICKQ